jgi:hypothetical protein
MGTGGGRDRGQARYLPHPLQFWKIQNWMKRKLYQTLIQKNEKYFLELFCIILNTLERRVKIILNGVSLFN